MQSFNWLSESLLEHQSESSMVREDELSAACAWMDALLEGVDSHTEEWVDGWIDGNRLFGFVCGDEDSEELLGRAKRQATTPVSADGKASCQLTWQDARTGLRVTCDLKRYECFPALEWLVTLSNDSRQDTPLITDVDALRLRLRRGADVGDFVVHGASGGRSKRDDLMPFSVPVPSDNPNSHLISFDGGFPSSNVYLPFFNFEAPGERGIVLGIGWSGHWKSTAAAVDDDLCVSASLGEVSMVLRPGESVRLPKMLALIWKGRRLHGQNVFRRLLHTEYVPGLFGEPQRPLVSINVGFTHHGYGRFLEDADEKNVLSLVEPSAKLGAELVTIDAGWYDCEGDWSHPSSYWRHDRNRYPEGFARIFEQLDARKMILGLWFAPEWGIEDLEEFAEHPEWAVDGFLQMSNPEARELFLSRVDDYAENQGLSCFRQDMLGRYDDEEPDRAGMSELGNIDGLYECWKQISRRHPGIVMEGCCGGGQRIDLQTLSFFHWHQKSDRWFDPESDQCGLYGSSLFLPGGVINIPTKATDDYGAWSSFAGQLCLAWHPVDVDFPSREAARQVDRYKRIRNLLSGDFYPLTSCSLDSEWMGYQFHRHDLDKGFALVFRRAGVAAAPCPASTSFILRLRGLTPGSTYSTTFERSGRILDLTCAKLAEGVELIMRNAPCAEMVIYERNR